MENPKREMPCGRLKAEVRPLVSLPTAKPLSWFFTSRWELTGRQRVETGWAALSLHLRRLPDPGRGQLSCGCLLQHPGLSLALGEGSLGKSQFCGVEPRWVLCEQSHPRGSRQEA